MKNVRTWAVCVILTAFDVIEPLQAGRPDIVMQPGVTVI